MINIDIKSFALGVSSNSGGYPEPTGTKNITENGIHNVKDYAEANVQVPVPPSPTGTINITQNGTYDVTEKAEAQVNVPTTEPDLEDITITANGTYESTQHDGYGEVTVNVPDIPADIEALTVNANGTYTATECDGFSPVTVNVPIPTPDLEDITITQNGTYNHPNKDGYDEVTVNVPNTYTLSDEGKVVNNGALASQTSTTKTANGTYDTTLNNEVVVNVPNSYSQSDEGKVVSSGALVSQTATTKTENGTYDTTLNNSITVNVQGAVPTTQTFTIDKGTTQSWNWLNVNLVDSTPKFKEINIVGDFEPDTTRETYLALDLQFAETVNILAPNLNVVNMGNIIPQDCKVFNAPYMTTWRGTPTKATNLEELYVPSVNTISNGSIANGMNKLRIIDVSGLTNNINNSNLILNQKLSLVEVRLSDNLTQIITNMFLNDYNLETINLPSALTTIGDGAFQNCSKAFTDLVLPSGVNDIGSGAFYGCNLQSVTFTRTPTGTINSSAFSNNSGLTDIYVPWSEGEVANAPWGATNATIHYNWSN